MNNNIQCSIESSTTKIELNSAVDGVFLVPELEGLVGLPEIRTTSGVNAGYDGGWTSAQNYDARLISIRGVIANPDISKVEDKRRAIASLLGQGRKEQLTLRFTTEAGNAYAISVRTISCEMALQRVLTTQEFLIQLRADDPLIYDDGTTGGIAAILQPQRALGGFEINFGLPLAIGGGAEDTVVDNGNETVYPVIKLYGALHSPTVVNRTTNQQMQILADLQYSVDWHTYRSATGDYILVNDGLNGAPMTLSQLTGNAEQETTTGKNSFGASQGSTTNNGVTSTIKDGAITLNGTTTGAGAIGIANQEIHYTPEGGDTYTFTIWLESGAATFTLPDDCGFYIRKSDGTPYATNATLVMSKVRQYGFQSTTFTAPSATPMHFLISANKAGIVFNNVVLRVQVEKGSTKTDWEEYTAGASPNPSYPQPISTVTGAQNVKVVGKNLLNDSIIQRTIPSSDNFNATIPMTIKAGTYSFGAFANGVFCPEAHYYAFQFRHGSTPIVHSSTPPTPMTLTAEEASQVDNMFFYFNVNFTGEYGGKHLTAMVCSGSTLGAYESYQNQSYEVNLGKNLIDINSLATGGVTVSNGVATGTGNQFYASFGQNTDGVPFIKKNGQLTISFKAYTDGNVSTANTDGLVVRVVYTDGTSELVIYCKNNETTAVQHTTITTFGKDVASIQLSYANDGGNIWHISEFQIEKGSQATSYAPYFTPIELAKIGNYQDRIYKNDGKWYIEKQVGKVVLDGTTTLSQLQASTNTTRVVATISSEYDAPLSTVQIPLCDYFTGNSSVWSTDIQGIYIQSRYTVLRANNATVGTTLDSFKTWLTSHPTTVYYALATPTTTEITDETLLAQLNFLASLYEGENNISLMGTGAQGEMTVRYATDYTVNPDVITIDSQARTITLNGQDVYHLKTSESEFLVLAPGENKLYLTSEVSDDSGYAEVKFKQGYLSI